MRLWTPRGQGYFKSYLTLDALAFWEGGWGGVRVWFSHLRRRKVLCLGEGVVDPSRALGGEGVSEAAQNSLGGAAGSLPGPGRVSHRGKWCVY